MFDIPLQRSTRIHRAIAKHSVLDGTEGDAGKAEADMGTTRNSDPTAVRDDLHQRFSRHGQLLDMQVIRGAPELPLDISPREITR